MQRAKVARGSAPSPAGQKDPVDELAPAWVAGAFAAPDHYAALLKRDGREELIVACR